MLTRNKKRKLPDIAGGYLLSHEVLNVSKRRQMNSKLNQIEYLSQFISQRKKKRISPNTFKLFKRSKGSKYLLRREHSEDIQALVIYLRHGSMKSDERTLRSLTEIYRMTGVKPCSQLKIFSRWKQRGFLIMRWKRDGMRQKLS